MPSALAFCATAPCERPSFFAACRPESRSFAMRRSVFTSSVVQARAMRRFCFPVAMIDSLKYP